MTAGAERDVVARGHARRTGVPETALPGPPSGVAWQFLTQGNVFSAPAAANGLACFGGRDKSLHAVELATGRER